MANLYRFFIVIFFASLSSAIALENCRVEQVVDEKALANSFGQIASGFGNTCYSNTIGCNGNGPNVYYPAKNGTPNLYSWQRCHGKNGSCSDFSAFASYIDKEVCEPEEPEEPSKPDLTEWGNCKKGKDHGFSWITIGDASGEGESRFKREFWSCDDPDFWETYDHPPEKIPTDPEEPINPTDPKPGEGGDGDNPGEGGDNGSGDGGDNGGCIGNNCGTGNGNNEGDGEGLSKGEITEAIKDADILGCKGNGCEAVDLKGQGTDSDFAEIPTSFWESKYESHDLMKLYNEKIESKGDSIVGQLRMINTNIGQGTCPVFQLPGDFGTFQMDCDFLELIRSSFIFSATLSALFIIFRR